VIFAAAFNFIALFIFHLKVAATVGMGIVDPVVVDTICDLRGRSSAPPRGM
jgi:PiT family inorganic phosphate transporter